MPEFALNEVTSLSMLAARAEKVLSPEAWAYYRSGACDERTLAANEEAFRRRTLLPRVLAPTGQRSLRTTVLGAELALPVLIAPTAMHRLADADGEVATARAAAAAGTVMTLSTFATRSVEDVCATGANVWFQLYPLRDRGATRDLVRRAIAAGARAIVLTADMPVLGKRESDISVPLRLPPDVRYAHLPDTTDTVQVQHTLQAQLDPNFGWSDLEQLCGECAVPVAVKGVLRADDAERAAASGVAAVIVSNHGGRQLDGSVASLDALPSIAERVPGSLEVLVDGGVRRGTDVLIALALGARAVLLGRPVLWGLAVGGDAGVARVFEILREEIDLALALCGCASVIGVPADLIAGAATSRGSGRGRAPRRSDPHRQA
jgi:4-hydroxymandelate oxidase